MASWTQNQGSDLLHARCPVHGSLVVQTAAKRWLWKCHECLQEAGYALACYWNGSR